MVIAMSDVEEESENASPLQQLADFIETYEPKEEGGLIK